MTGSNEQTNLLSQLISGPLLPPALSTLNESVHNPGFRFHDHTYMDEVEIIYITYGSSYVGINNQFIRVKKNECLIIFPKVTHNFFLKENQSCRMIDVVLKPGDISQYRHFHLQENMRFFYELLEEKLAYLRFVDNGEIKNVLERILAQNINPSQQSGMLVRLYFAELYLLLSKVIGENSDDLYKPKTRYVSDALDYMINFYSNPTLTVDEIAAHAGISARHLSRLFLNELGINVQDYLTILKIKKAKDLLRSSDMDITRIAFSLGFNSSQYFITCFKKIEHVTPGMYRSLAKAGGYSIEMPEVAVNL
jgi:AraC-like DNA-binding protein